MSGFVRFGTGDKYGNTGKDDVTGDPESGYELTLFQGQWLSPTALAEALDSDVDQIRSEDFIERQSFRDSAGISR